MAKLTYWYSSSMTDSKAYNIRAKTRKECVSKRNEEAGVPADYPANKDTPPESNQYSKVAKAELEYNGALDLVIECLSEGGGYWEEDKGEYGD